MAEIRGRAQRQRALPESGLGKAITRFLNDPRIPLDNVEAKSNLSA